MTWPALPSGAHTFALLSLPMLAHVIPTLVIGYGFVIPGSCISGINQHTLGFAAAVLGYVPNYYIGVYLARRLAKGQTVSE